VADAPTAEDVGNILIFVVPGFFARVGYTARFPQPQQEPSYALIVSVAVSVPLVAIARELAEGLNLGTAPTDPKFAVLLVVIGLTAGYLAALLRGSTEVRALAQRLRIPFEPEATIFEQTLLRLDDEEAKVTVGLKDDRAVSGYPALGPAYTKPGEARELYLVGPEWWDSETEQWIDGGAGIVINLDEVVTVPLDENPLAQSGRPASNMPGEPI
jgi:hypothetical protein